MITQTVVRISDTATHDDDQPKDLDAIRKTWLDEHQQHIRSTENALVQMVGKPSCTLTDRSSRDTHLIQIDQLVQSFTDTSAAAVQSEHAQTQNTTLLRVRCMASVSLSDSRPVHLVR